MYDRRTSDGKVVVTRISGHQDFIEPDAVSMTDWLRIMVQEEATRDPSHSAAREALNRLELRPREGFTVAASRLVKLYRTTVSEPNRPHVSEVTFFWRYASIETLLDLLKRFYILVKKSSTMAEFLWAKYRIEVVTKLRDYPINKSNPAGSLMQARGQVDKNIFWEFVDSNQMHHCLFLKSQIEQQTTNVSVKTEPSG